MRSSREDIAALQLIARILEEAKSDSGTWSFATYVRLRTEVPKLTPEQAALFVTRIIEEMIQPHASPLERFKLAQLCTLLTAPRFPDFRSSTLFAPHAPRVLERMLAIEGSHELGKPTVKLLMGVFEHRGDGPIMGSPSKLSKSASAARHGIARAVQTARPNKLLLPPIGAIPPELLAGL
jgi:hypothetical protein